MAGHTCQHALQAVHKVGVSHEVLEGHVHAEAPVVLGVGGVVDGLLFSRPKGHCTAQGHHVLQHSKIRGCCRPNGICEVTGVITSSKQADLLEHLPAIGCTIAIAIALPTSIVMLLAFELVGPV